jgi:hypothetical protein
MLRMCVYMHSRFVENHPIRILEDGPLISEGDLSHPTSAGHANHNRYKINAIVKADHLPSASIATQRKMQATRTLYARYFINSGTLIDHCANYTFL